MAKAQSLENDLYPFDKFGKTTGEKLLSEDYPYNHFETYKFKATTSNGAAVAYKANFDITKKGDVFAGKGIDELKVTFPIKDTDFIARLLTSRKGGDKGGDLEAHLDFGAKEISGNPCNFFTNFKTGFAFGNIIVRAGANYFHPKLTVATHFETDLKKHSIWQRISGKQDKFRYGLQAKLGLSDQKLQQYDASLGLEDKDYDVYLKHTSGDKTDSIKLQKIGLSGVYRKNDYVLGLNVQKDFQGDQHIPNVEVGGSYKLDDKTNLKLKADQDLNLGLSAKYKYNNYYTVTAGAKFPFEKYVKGDKTPASESNFIPFDLGLQVDLNI